MILPLLLLAVLASQAEGLAISGNPVDPLGSNVTLYCYSSPLEWGVNWLTPYGLVVHNPSVIPGSTLAVRIHLLKKKDLGSWVCRANNNAISASIVIRLPGSDVHYDGPLINL